MTDQFSTSVTIKAAPAEVWRVLTDIRMVTQWSGEPEMKIEVVTDWKINSPIIIRGFHHIRFENKGTVLQFDREKKLSYSHLSSVSRLPDKPENYSILEFNLTPSGKQTLLELIISNFPTETIRKHLEFYWRTTVVKIKRMAEHW
ncbi:MAG: SRPBCC family protein [Ginsengibacter sp.]